MMHTFTSVGTAPRRARPGRSSDRKNEAGGGWVGKESLPAGVDRLEGVGIAAEIAPLRR
jgi:hypothetical protein